MLLEINMMIRRRLSDVTLQLIHLIRLTKRTTNATAFYLAYSNKLIDETGEVTVKGLKEKERLRILLTY